MCQVNTLAVALPIAQTVARAMARPRLWEYCMLLYYQLIFSLSNQNIVGPLPSHQVHSLHYIYVQGNRLGFHSKAPKWNYPLENSKSFGQVSDVRLST